jgi:competence protein ComEC
MKRPLLLVGLLFVGGILAAEYIPFSPIGLLSGSAALIVLAILLAPARTLLLYPAIFLTGAADLTLNEAAFSPNDLRNLIKADNEIVTVRGLLLETPVIHYHENKGRTSASTQAKVAVQNLRPNKGNWRPATGKIIISSAGEATNLFAGQMVEVSGVIGKPPQAIAEGLFDYRSYLSRVGYYFELRSTEKDWQILRSPKSPPLADRFRAWGRWALALGLPVEDESLHLEWALTLGWKPVLTDEVSEPFIRAATYHIFAVDGLRMAIIFGIFFFLLRACRVSRPVIGVILIPLIWFYVALTGWPASAIRATVMLTIVIIGWVLHRPGELINSLFAAALIILLWQPQQLFQAGFQLSFFVVLCIILTVPVLHAWGERMMAPDPLLPKALHRRWHPVIRIPARYVWDILITSFAAWIGSLPLVAYYFNIVTPVSTPANLIAVPLCVLVLASNLASLLLAAWFPFAAIIFNHAGWFLMEGIRVSSNWFADWPKAYAYVQAPSWFGTALYYAILIAIVSGWLFRPAWRAMKLGAAGTLIACWSILFWHDSLATRLTVLPLSGSSAVFFDAPGARNDLLIDCGRENAVNNIIKPFLRAQGVNRLGGFLVTHGEARVMAGAETLRRNIPIEHIYASTAASRSPDYRAFVESCNARPGGLTRVKREDHLGPWTVLHPDAAARFTQADDNAVVMLGQAAGVRVLTLSELGSEGQAALIAKDPELRAEIIIAGVPTRGEPVREPLLDLVQPRLIILTDSESPAQQRATSRLKARLAKRHVPVIYTRYAGAVTLEFKSGHWSVRTMEDEH